jgi:hypothetical protein
MRSIFVFIATVTAVGSVQAAEPITVHDAKIGDVSLHYLTAGHGPAVILLHGYTCPRGMPHRGNGIAPSALN